MTEFLLQFDPGEAVGLASRYSYADDSEARGAGRSAANRGHYDLDEFLTVCRWKAPRAERHFITNSAERVKEVTELAFETNSESERMEGLTSLAGVGIPMGSTLLQFAYPDAYPILDWRALEALGQPQRTQYRVSFWAEYLTACRRIAAEAGVNVRTLDKALWQWSREKSQESAPPSKIPPDEGDKLDEILAKLTAIDARVEVIERRLDPP